MTPVDRTPVDFPGAKGRFREKLQTAKADGRAGTTRKAESVDTFGLLH
jgi:hypothetical protein